MGQVRDSKKLKERTLGMEIQLSLVRLRQTKDNRHQMTPSNERTGSIHRSESAARN
jgi:hypothetical protein